MCGTGAAAAGAALGDGFALTEIRQPDALWVARLAMTRARARSAARAALSARARRQAAGTHPAVMTPRLFDPGKRRCCGAGGTACDLFSRCLERGRHSRTCSQVQASLRSSRRDGFVLARAAGDEAEILTLAVTPAARRQGIGRALVQAAAAHAQGLGAETLFLEVATGNDRRAGALCRAGLCARRGSARPIIGAEDAHVLKAALPLPTARGIRLTLPGNKRVWGHR